MRRLTLIGLLLGVLCGVGVWCFRYSSAKHHAKPSASHLSALAPLTAGETVISASTAPLAPLAHAASTNSAAERRAERLKYRLSNTREKLSELVRNDHAVLLENALIDTSLPLDLSIPDNLKAQGDPGSYIVQSRGVVDANFRSAVQASGASIVSYIPNNAFLVRASAAEAQQLAALPGTQAVLPFEPYYKLDLGLLRRALEGQSVPAGSIFNVVAYTDASQDALKAFQSLGLKLVRRDRSPFGPVFTVQSLQESSSILPTLASFPFLQRIESSSPRMPANDLSRAKVGVAADSITNVNYLNLSGSNVIVEVNDSGIDISHPDLAGRVFSEFPASLTDTNGHGTHVAGIIAGDGTDSLLVTNAFGSIMPATTNQFRGMAPLAQLYSQPFDLSDFQLEEHAALTNALISNNSWNYANNDYDIAAANYDAAVRDALPEVMGSQPVVFVFAAGNNGMTGLENINQDNGLGGNPESILSPATAKNVITVGALEQPRNITNEVVINGTTNQFWALATDSDDQVAAFSSRGNVGIEIEGDFGRFKPDVVAPGVFVVSTRSTTWDEASYYNPIYYHFNTRLNEAVDTNSLHNYFLLIPYNAIGFSINADAFNPVVDLPLYVNPSRYPRLTDVSVAINSVSIPGTPGLTLTPGNPLYYGIGNPTNEPVVYNLTTELITTNDNGNYFEVLSNLNNSISAPTNSPINPFYPYRYESGTSMAAADVSGVLALIEDYFTNQLRLRPSPALVKAMLINGARVANPDIYDFQVQNTINYQGWGAINLTNSIPSSLPTNASPADLIGTLTGQSGKSSPVLIFDQDPTNALATGERRTISVSIDPSAQNQPLRVTLVWTDPAGNPAAGVKLVNDLDLIVTNTDSSDPLFGSIYFGNDFQPNSTFNFPWDTNSPPNQDVINNVENVYLQPPLGTNYSITVVGHRVNVNAVTANPNKVAQDYALVISSGDGAISNALSVANIVATSTNAPNLTTVTNQFTGVPGISGQLLLGQHVGASSPLLGTNIIGLNGNALGPNTVWGTNGQITLGETNQWHFYVLTNDQSYTNVAFATFLPPNLATPPMGTTNVQNPDNSSRVEADIDLYVSQDPALLRLDPNAVATADKSLGRGGTEVIVYSNAPSGGTYYVGVKSEDQQAAEYGFIGVFSQLPFSNMDSNGVEHVRGINVPAPIPDGSPAHPGAAQVIGIAVQPITMRRVVVTNVLLHENIGDLLGMLRHNRKSVVLNNHTFGTTNQLRSFIYEDNGENDIPGSVHTDGPGSLRSFTGDHGEGVWLLTELDTALTRTGAVENVGFQLDPQSNTNGTILKIQPNSFAYDAIDVPVNATNLTIGVSGNTLPVQLYVRRGDFPSQKVYDYIKTINPPGDSLSITLGDLPPLEPGRYYIGVYNPNNVAQTVRLVMTLELDLSGVVPVTFSSSNSVPILDDAVTYSRIQITNDQTIAEAMVGLVIKHPRISDLVLTLISPTGKRILLMENRGGPNAADLGSATTVTNFFPQTTSGQGAAAATNTIGPVPTSGTLVINYSFESIPDTMHVYYDGRLIYNTGLVSGNNSFSVAYGPGVSTNIQIIMNEGGNSDSNTVWSYTASVVSLLGSYFTFTDDTNFAQIPIKFAVPPFTSTNTGSTSVLSTFDTAAAGEYLSSSVMDGWSVANNQVSIVSDAANAQSGSQFLALANGTITRKIATAPGNKYALSFACRGPGIVSWWRGESTAYDCVGTNNCVFFGGGGFTAGEVGGAFNFPGANNAYLTAPANSTLNVGTGSGLTIEMWANPISVLTRQALAEWNGNSGDSGIGAHFFIAENPTGGSVPGNLYVNLVDNTGAGHIAATGGGVATSGQFQHLVMTYNKNSGILCIYRNGNPVLTQNIGSFTPQTSYDFYMGTRKSGYGAGAFFKGVMDEPSLYGRFLSPSEIKAIYLCGANGKFDPGVSPPQNLAMCQIFVDGISAGTFLGDNTKWQTKVISFSGNMGERTLQIAGLQPGMLVDSFALTQAGNGLFYMPEESLDSLIGDSSKGTWTLEVRDDRVGALSGTPPPEIVSWQMQFVFVTNTPVPINLTNGAVVTNTIPPCGIQYFTIDVPPWAAFATNTLLFATTNVNVWFNQTNAPVGTNPPDFLLLTGTSGTNVLSAGSTPPLIAGSRYYLAVENPCSNGTNVTYALSVDFGLNIITLTNATPYFNTNSGVTNATDYYRFVVPTNAARAQFEIDNPSGDMTLVVREGLPLPSLFDNDYSSSNPGTNNELIIVLTNSTPVPLAPGDWYLTAVNVSGAPVSYGIMATWWPITGQPITITGTQITLVGTNGCFNITWNSLPGAYYYVQGVTDLNHLNWATVSPTIQATTNVTSYCVPLPSPYHFFRVVEGLALDTVAPPTNFTGTRTPGGFLLQWEGPVWAHYQVQWSPSLSPASWTAFTGIVTSTTGVFTYLDDGTQTGGFGTQRFYRVVQVP